MLKSVRREPRSMDMTVTAFRDGQVTLRSNRRIDGFTESVKDIGYQGVRQGEVVIHSMDAFAGAIGVSDSDGKMSPVVHIYTAPSDSPEFLVYSLRVASRAGFIRALAKGIRERSTSFDRPVLKTMLLPRPPRKDQDAIVEYLDRETQNIDDLIDEQRGLIETLRERRQAVIERAVTCGISDAQLGESSIPWIARMPLDWGVSRMKHETAMTTGGTPDTDDLAYWSEASDEAGVPWVAISDMSRRRSVCSTSKRLTPAGVASKRLRIGKAGTILFAMYASVGEVSRLDVDATWNQAILGITPGDRLESGYLAYLLMAMRTFMLGEVRTNTQANLNARQVGDMPLPIPLLEEQREIVDYLDEQTAGIDELISESEDLIALSQERRAALITAAVTGQIDVREAA